MIFSHGTRTLKVVIGAVFSLTFLYLALRDVRLGNLLTIIKGINIPLLFVPIMFSWVGLFQRAIRWRYMLASVKREKLINLFSAMMVGYLGNNIFPARAGEFLRIYVMDKKYGYGKSQSLGTIVLEKVFDVLTLMVFFLIVLFFMPFPSAVMSGGILLGVALTGVISLLFLFARNKEKALACIDFVASPFPEKAVRKVKETLSNFDAGLAILKKKRGFGIVVIHSVGIWFTEFFFVYLILGAFHLHLSIFVAAFLTIMLNFGMLIPSSPGYIGTYQAICIAALTPFGVDKELALSVSLVMHVLALTITTGIGIVCFWKEKIVVPAYQ